MVELEIYNGINIGNVEKGTSKFDLQILILNQVQIC